MLITMGICVWMSSCSVLGGGSGRNPDFVIDSLNHVLQAEIRLNRKYQSYINQILPKIDKSLKANELTAINEPEPGDFMAHRRYPDKVAQVKKGRVIPMTEKEVEFQIGSSELSPTLRQRLELMADSLKNSSKYLILVEGHADENEAQNRPDVIDSWELSTARANAVARFLAARGVYPHMIAATGRGNFKPKIAYRSGEINAINRRVDIYLQSTNDAD